MNDTFKLILKTIDDMQRNLEVQLSDAVTEEYFNTVVAKMNILDDLESKVIDLIMVD